MNEVIPITRENYRNIKRLYDQAVAAKQERFETKWGTMLVAYAKYVLEYMETKPGIKTP